MSTKLFNKYIDLYEKLIKLINESNKRVLAEESDGFIDSNINFFNKSFMVISCAYLESYLKEISWEMISEIEGKLKEQALPANLIRWSISGEKFNKKDITYENFMLGISKKDVDEQISGNVGKTISLFTKMGIDLNKNLEFEGYKEKISSIVTKRNNVIHHNDDASDVSFNDIIININIIKEYMKAIDKEVLLNYKIDQ